MNIIHLTDLDHPGVQPYAHLTEAQLRNRLEPDKGIFICESPKVIRVVLDAGYQPLSLLTEEKFLDTQAAEIIARHPDMPVYTGSRELHLPRLSLIRLATSGLMNLWNFPISVARAVSTRRLTS